ncbi:MAG: hypothetical protein AVDCRST_MAG04-3339, partial [uncultured Acetobacteraceae bacterium]
ERVAPALQPAAAPGRAGRRRAEAAAALRPQRRAAAGRRGAGRRRLARLVLAPRAPPRLEDAAARDRPAPPRARRSARHELPRLRAGDHGARPPPL